MHERGMGEGVYLILPAITAVTDLRWHVEAIDLRRAAASLPVRCDVGLLKSARRKLAIPVKRLRFR